MTIIGQPRSFHHKSAFVVVVDDLGSSSFKSCSELSGEVANVIHWEGGRRIPHKAPGRLTFSDVTLERGATRDLDLYLWFKEVADVAAGMGEVDDHYKRTLDIVQQDRDGSTRRRWTLFRAWPVKFVAGEWDNDSDEVVIESVTLTYDWFDTPTPR